MCRHNTSPAAVCSREGATCRTSRRGRRRRTRSARAIASWVGWESNPRHGGLRDRYKASVCYRPSRPTPWNRTRTSRASAERADHMRQSGSSGCPRHAGTLVVHLFGCQGTSPRRGQTSGGAAPFRRRSSPGPRSRTWIQRVRAVRTASCTSPENSVSVSSDWRSQTEDRRGASRYRTWRVVVRRRFYGPHRLLSGLPPPKTDPEMLEGPPGVVSLVALRGASSTYSSYAGASQGSLLPTASQG